MPKNDLNDLFNMLNKLRISLVILNNKVDRWIKPRKKKGSYCSINGNNYEKQIHKVIKQLVYNGKKFTKQSITELGGSTCSNDLNCIYNDKIIGIEAKKCNTPDWMQCSLKYNNKSWVSSTKGKIPVLSRNIFNNIFRNVILFDGKIPPFFNRKIKHEEWLDIKKNTNQWNDAYFHIKNDTIKNLYIAKGCYYIQISTYGLYHLGDDIYNFNVPEFICEQQVRIRTKIHTRKDKNGFCSLSVTAACQPKDIKTLTKSKYSLDDISKIPKNLSINQ
jgi:hypothetical protein